MEKQFQTDVLRENGLVTTGGCHRPNLQSILVTQMLLMKSHENERGGKGSCQFWWCQGESLLQKVPKR